MFNGKIYPEGGTWKTEGTKIVFINQDPGTGQYYFEPEAELLALPHHESIRKVKKLLSDICKWNIGGRPVSYAARRVMIKAVRRLLCSLTTGNVMLSYHSEDGIPLRWKDELPCR